MSRWLEETGNDRGATYHAATYHAAFRQLQEQGVDVHGEARYVERLLAASGRRTPVARAWLSRLRWLSSQPFGRPVVPDV